MLNNYSTIKRHFKSPLPFTIFTVSCQAHLQAFNLTFLHSFLFLLKIQTLSFLYLSLIAITETP